MELRQLRYLLAVAEEGSITRAAQRVYVTQPALSQQLQLLERELGTALLDRSGRRVRLTPAGEILVRSAREVIRQLEEARTAIRELMGLERGELTLGVVQTVNMYLMPLALSRFWECYPKVRLHVEELAADDIEARLLEGTLDIGISFLPPRLEGLESHPLFSEELVLLLRRQHPLASRRSIRVAELQEVPLVLLPRRFCTRRLWDRCAAEAGVHPRVVGELNTIDGLLGLVHRLDVATILPRLALHSPLAEGLAAVSLRDPTPLRTVGGLFRKGGYTCTASRAFWNVLQEVLQHWLSDDVSLAPSPFPDSPRP